MKNIKTLLIVIFSAFSFVAFAQTGKVAGVVIDGEFNDVLAFANIVIKDTSTGTTSDFDGKYELEVDPGTYTLVFSYVGYETKEITDVVVKANQVTDLEVTLATNSLDEVVIKTSAKRNTESAVLNMQRKSAVVLDGLSAQSIKKSGASNVASAVKSIPGVSVQGGKYVFVRGLGDRYTKSMLNGLDIPGLDPDRNTIPMDIFPTNMIDNVIVSKTAAADYPADFTGGIVDIVTKDLPTKPEYGISMGVGYNPNMHFKDDYLTHEGGDTDFFGYDDGTRNLPINRYQKIPGTFENRGLLTQLTNRFQKQLKADQETSFMNYSFGLSAGNQYEVGEDNQRIGYLASIAYKNDTEFYDDRIDATYERFPVAQNNNDLYYKNYSQGQVGENEITVSGLLGLTYKTNLSKFKLTGIHIQNGLSGSGFYEQEISEAGIGSGYTNATLDALTYTESSLTSLSLTGNHQLGANTGWKFDWAFSPSFSKVYDKDHRFTPLRLDEGAYTVSPSAVNNPTRIWRTLNEEGWISKAGFDKKVELFSRPGRIKFGGSYKYKFRDFSTDNYIFNTTNIVVPNGNSNLLLLTENIWNKETQSGTFLDPNNIFDPANSYEGEQNIGAAYVSTEFNASEKLKVILGLRTEQFILYYSGINKGVAVSDLKTIDEFDFYPSANFVYALNEDANLRLSYSRTTSRPSFKEASSAQIADPITKRIFIGGLDNGVTPAITPSYADNIDARYEWYRENGQMIALSGFYKNIQDPIEYFFYLTAPEQYTVGNLGNAKVFGAEVEFRQNISENFKFIANASYINSQLEMGDLEYNSRLNAAREGETIDRKRDLQGQSPFAINGVLDYANENGLKAALLYNVQGKTLEIVGTGNVPDVYTKPFHSLNFTLNKSFGEEGKTAVDLKVNNILNSKRKSVYEAFGTSDQIFSQYSPGIEFSLGLSHKF